MNFSRLKQSIDQFLPDFKRTFLTTIFGGLYLTGFRQAQMLRALLEKWPKKFFFIDLIFFLTKDFFPIKFIQMNLMAF
jgi:hypothetical protein